MYNEYVWDRKILQPNIPTPQFITLRSCHNMGQTIQPVFNIRMRNIPVNILLTVSLYGIISNIMSFHSNFIFSMAFSNECSLAAAAPISSNLYRKQSFHHIHTQKHHQNLSNFCFRLHVNYEEGLKTFPTDVVPTYLARCLAKPNSSMLFSEVSPCGLMSVPTMLLICKITKQMSLAYLCFFNKACWFLNLSILQLISNFTLMWTFLLKWTDV